MLHWNDTNLPTGPLSQSGKGAGLLLAIAAVCVGAGCGPKKDAPAAPSASVAAPRPTPSAGLPIAAAVQGVEATLFNQKGEIVAKIKAQAGAAGTHNENGAVRPDGLGILKVGEAVLYQNGKPAAVMNADTMTADRAAKTVVGVGNVRVRSLTKDAQNNASAIRADTMTWRHDSNKIRGKGNVRVTNGPEVELPGENFEADTFSRTFRVWNGAEPKAATGTTGTF